MNELFLKEESRYKQEKDELLINIEDSTKTKQNYEEMIDSLRNDLTLSRETVSALIQENEQCHM